MRGDERRASILSHAKKAFAEHSYHEVSTGELARASGITEPILYKHFGSKKKLYIAVLTLIGEQFLDRFQSMVNRRAEENLADCLASLLLDFRTASFEDHDSMHLLLNATLESTDPEVLQITQIQNRKMYTLILGLLEKAQNSGLVSENLNLSTAAWGFISFLFALQYRAKLQIFEQFNEQTIRDINRLWLQALKIG
jgi:AcrR family transcriptional regulator